MFYAGEKRPVETVEECQNRPSAFRRQLGSEIPNRDVLFVAGTIFRHRVAKTERPGERGQPGIGQRRRGDRIEVEAALDAQAVGEALEIQMRDQITESIRYVLDGASRMVDGQAARQKSGAVGARVEPQHVRRKPDRRRVAIKGFVTQRFLPRSAGGLHIGIGHGLRPHDLQHKEQGDKEESDSYKSHNDGCFLGMMCGEECQGRGAHDRRERRA